jgi:tetratricopeptide (TPR) repeat protein
MDPINFGEVPADIDELLQRGVVNYRTSPKTAESCFREALARAPNVLPVYFCLYKIHSYQGELSAALDAANAGLAEATRQAGLTSDMSDWPCLAGAGQGPRRFVLYTLKALAFIHLKRGAAPDATQILAQLKRLDPDNQVGWSVVAELGAALS